MPLIKPFIMPFETEKERLAHPEACLIPGTLLRTLFKSTLSDIHLELMRTPFAPHSPLIDTLKGHDALDKLRYWLCIALSQPATNDDELIQLARAFEISTYYQFKSAALAGRLGIINRIAASSPPGVVSDLIRANDFEAFHWAAQAGHLPILARLVELAAADAQNMIEACDYVAFVEAAKGGHLPFLERLMVLAPTNVLNMIQARSYIAFRSAAWGGHLHIMERLMALVPAYIQDMIKADHYGAFRGAATGGHLYIMERLIGLAPDAKLNMIKAADYDAFRWAAKGGHLHIIEKLVTLAPAEVLNMIKADGHLAFCWAAQNGHLDIIEKLIQLTHTGGHLSIAERMMALTDNQTLKIVKACDFAAFRLAAAGGHLPILEKLMALAPAQVVEMLQADNYNAFRWAARENHLPVINRLLSFPVVLAYAEKLEVEYSRFTHPFINSKLSLLRSQRQTLELADPHAIFNLTERNDIRSCFYIIRNLIRRNDIALLADIRFLLEIPAVKAVAHFAVTAREQPNELVRLALTSFNQAAAVILLNIPAVRELAARDNYYRTDYQGAIDLGALARDRESSTRTLSPGEQDRLASAIARYQPNMLEKGIRILFDGLRKELTSRYHKCPASIMIGSKKTVLPVNWEDFSLLTLTIAQRQEALVAYYQHKDHSALRYLSRPNPWISRDASWVEVNPANTHERWSSYEDHKPLLVMLWLAVQDESITPTDGHTIEGRIAHFIDELAQLGRTHNWDHHRVKTNSSGTPILDATGAVITEEYDDLAGDKPSCRTGVKRRLLQSVIGHPLIAMLTPKIVEHELRDFIRAHFTRLITDENRVALHNAWSKYCVSVELADALPLRALDLSAAQQAMFIQQLSTKYGCQYSKDPQFKRSIETAFALIESTSNPSDCMHALKFAALVNLEHILITPIVIPVATAGARAAPLAIGSNGFFAQTSSQRMSDAPAAGAGVSVV